MRMHEASLALGILKTVVDLCRDGGFIRVESVRVRIGRAAGVLPEALSFAFDVAKADTIAREASLVIDLVPVGGVCRACGRDFEVVHESYVFHCPTCGSPDLQVSQGDELFVMDMEVD